MLPADIEVDLTQPYAALFWSVVIALVFVGGPLVVGEIRRGRRDRAAEAECEEMSAATAPDAAAEPPAAPMAAEPLAETPASTDDTADATRVILLPRNGGRHAAPVGVARVPLNIGRLPRVLRRRDGSWRA